MSEPVRLFPESHVLAWRCPVEDCTWTYWAASADGAERRAAAAWGRHRVSHEQLTLPGLT